MEGLHTLLMDRREEVMLRWRAMVQGTVAPESMSVIELVDHLPVFLTEVIAALRTDAGLSSTVMAAEDSQTAADHGEQRLRLGFSLDEVVREYGALRDAILGAAQNAGAEPSNRELQIIFNQIINGIAHAVLEYSRQRDAELHRQHNEHFAFVAHELRNPLHAAMSALDLLQARGELQAGTKSVAALERGLNRMRDLIDHSLMVAREASGIEMRPELVELRALLEEAELSAAPAAETKGVQLRVVVEDTHPVEVDMRLMRSALNNLVGNAVKFTAPGGVVELRSTGTRGRVVIEVEDCCGGLPPGKVEEAFAPFVRLKSAESGFGLGLAIAKQAVVAHGGSIRVQNLPGKGCIFILELPTTSVGRAAG